MLIIIHITINFHRTTIVTRSKKRICDAFGITGCYVRLETSLRTEVLNWLKKTDPKNPENTNHRYDSKPRRRDSVVGASLCSVNNNVQEHSSDYLEKVRRPFAITIENESVSASSVENPQKLIASTYNVGSLNVGSSDQAESSQDICCNSSNVSDDGNKKKMVLNHFDPFRRLLNLPFAIRGRYRSQSVDCIPSRRPSLSTIYEHELEHQLTAEPLIYDGESDDSSSAVAKPVDGVAEVISQLQMDGANDSHAEAQMSSDNDAAIVSKLVARFENFEL